MGTANNYMFRPLTRHHQVVHPMKRVEGCHQTEVTLYIVQPKNPFHCVYNLMMAC